MLGLGGLGAVFAGKETAMGVAGVGEVLVAGWWSASG